MGDAPPAAQPASILRLDGWWSTTLGIECDGVGELAARQMRAFGGIVTVEFEDEATARRFLRRSQLFVTAESLGGVESLADHPGIMTHSSVPDHLREALGISGGLIRLSVGIEDEQDLLADLEQAVR